MLPEAHRRKKTLAAFSEGLQRQSTDPEAEADSRANLVEVVASQDVFGRDWTGWCWRRMPDALPEIASGRRPSKAAAAALFLELVEAGRRTTRCLPLGRRREEKEEEKCPGADFLTAVGSGTSNREDVSARVLFPILKAKAHRRQAKAAGALRIHSTCVSSPLPPSPKLHRLSSYHHL